MKRETCFQLICIICTCFMTASVYAQSCSDNIMPNAMDNRYIDNDDGTVTDKVTSLMWMKCSIGQSGADCNTGTVKTFSWDKALQYPDSIDASGGFSGFSDWRLPNLKELSSLVEMACLSPAINSSYFPNTPRDTYWSSTPDGGNSVSLTFLDGYFGQDNRTEEFDVRLVRDGQ